MYVKKALEKVGAKERTGCPSGKLLKQDFRVKILRSNCIIQLDFFKQKFLTKKYHKKSAKTTN